MASTIEAPPMGAGDEFWHWDEVRATEAYGHEKDKIERAWKMLGLSSLKEAVFTEATPRYQFEIPLRILEEE